MRMSKQQTNPWLQSEEISVQEKEKSGDWEIVTLTEAAGAREAITFVWQTETGVWDSAGTNSCYQPKQEAVQRETEASRLS